jgi:hypothetical protein
MTTRGAGGVPFVESLPRYHGKNRPGDGRGSRSPLFDSVVDALVLFARHAGEDFLTGGEGVICNVPYTLGHN